MTEIKFSVTQDNISFEDLLAIEDAQNGKNMFHAIYGIAAKCMVDGSGQPLPLEEAQNALKKLSLAQTNTVMKELTSSISALKDSAVPPTSGG